MEAKKTINISESVHIELAIHIAKTKKKLKRNMTSFTDEAIIEKIKREKNEKSESNNQKVTKR